MRLVALFIVSVLLVACEPPGYGRHEDAAIDGKTTDGHAAADAAIDGHANGACTDMFRLDGHGAASSCVVTGEFTMPAWSIDPAHAVVLTKGQDGAWSGAHDFTPGTYQYKFVVDSTMYLADPNNPNFVDDGFGGHNSLYTCN